MVLHLLHGSLSTIIINLTIKTDHMRDWEAANKEVTQVKEEVSV